MADNGSSLTPVLALQGLSIMVTRPVQQAAVLLEKVRTAGASAVALPVMEIQAVTADLSLQVLFTELENFDLAIFISVNALLEGLQVLQQYRSFPETLKIAVIGQSTAEKIQEILHRPADICPPKDFHSEGLLALESMQDFSGKNVIIFRGTGGRDFLRQNLQKRGADVRYAEVYQRCVPDVPISVLQKIWQDNAVDVITLSSAEGLQNLYQLFNQPVLNLSGHRDSAIQWLRQKQLVVPTERMYPLIRKLGFVHAPVLASSATDRAMLEALHAWNNNFSAISTPDLKSSMQNE